MNILGINSYHGDASAAVIQDGRLVAAVEEERFNRVKHWAGFPAQSIRYCLRAAGLRLEDVHHVAFSFNPKANLARKALFAITQRPSIASVIDRLKRQGKALSLQNELARTCEVSPETVKAQIHNVEHHDAHIAAGLFLSGMEEAAVLSIDGMGDFVSTVSAKGRLNSFQKLNEVFYPHSLGFLYNAVTIYLGFPHYGDEYKVMGLAPYGSPKYLPQFRKIIEPHGPTFRLNLDCFTHVKQGIAMSWEGGKPHVEPFHSPALEELLGPARRPDEDVTRRHEDVAASLQAVTEEIVFHMLDSLHDEVQQDHLVLVGGCAMNSVANGKVSSQTPFKHVYVPAGAADNGTSFGAAFYVWHTLLEQPLNFQLDHAFWGDEFSDVECERAIQQKGFHSQSLESDKLLDRVVSDLIQGKVVGWFQGRMEFGARALGNRSLLADPRREDMRDIINLKIKFRERFRPFAPSILEEYVSEYFEIDEPSPFMERVLPVRQEKHAVIPAVTHVDGSGRLQTVSRKTNPLYWSLIDRFRQQTGVPVLLNTSLNENEPIVRTPSEAIECFRRTSMDALVLGSHIIERNAG